MPEKTTVRLETAYECPHLHDVIQYHSTDINRLSGQYRVVEI